MTLLTKIRKFDPFYRKVQRHAVFTKHILEQNNVLGKGEKCCRRHHTKKSHFQWKTDTLENTSLSLTLRSDLIVVNNSESKIHSVEI